MGSNVETEYSADMNDVPGTMSRATMGAVWLQISADTNEPARVLARIEGLKSTVVGEARDTDFGKTHVLKINLMKIGVLGEPAKIQLWAEDPSENTGTWGPYVLRIPDKQEFAAEQAESVGSRRLSLRKLNLTQPLISDAAMSGAARLEPAAVHV